MPEDEEALTEELLLFGMGEWLDAKAWAVSAFQHQIRLVEEWTIPENDPSVLCSHRRIEGDEYDLVLRYAADPMAVALVGIVERKSPGFTLTALYHLQRLQALLEDEASLRRAHFGLRKTFGEDQRLGNDIDAHQWLSSMAGLARKLEGYGVPPAVSVAAFDVDAGIEAACDQLSLRLLALVEQRTDSEKQGKTHLVRSHDMIPDSLVNEAALRMLEALSEALEPPPSSLRKLLRVQLNRAGTPAFVPKRGEERKDLAVLLIASDPSLSARTVGKAVGVAHTTIRAWQQEPDFQERVRTSSTVKNVKVLLKRLVD